MGTICRYSAALRLDPDLPAVAVKSRVESVLSTLGLTHIRSNTVLSGTGVSGVSGGERRRVAIGMELVIDPQVRIKYLNLSSASFTSQYSNTLFVYSLAMFCCVACIHRHA